MSSTPGRRMKIGDFLLRRLEEADVRYLPYDALAPVTNSSNKEADLNYGPRGPQHWANLQLRPTVCG